MDFGFTGRLVIDEEAFNSGITMRTHLFLFLLMAMSGAIASGQAPLFSRGLTAEKTITGAGILTFDSFDSGDPIFSVPGRDGMAPQYDPTRRKDNGDIAAGQGIEIDLGLIQIAGKILTGAGASVFIGSNGFAGDLNWYNQRVPGIQPGYLLTNFNEVYPTISAPPGELQPLTNVSLPWLIHYQTECLGCDCVPFEPDQFVITNIYEITRLSYPSTNCLVGEVSTNWNGDQISSYTFYQIFLTLVSPVNTPNVFDYVFSDGEYAVSNLSGKVLFTGNASVHVTGDMNITGQGGIWVQTNSSCKLFVAGTNSTLSGQGLKNLTGDASKFQYFGLTSNDSMSVVMGERLIGTIYAPQANLSFKGSGSDVSEIIGAIVCESASFNGKIYVHYDEHLRVIGPTASPVLRMTRPNETNQLSFLLTCLESDRLYSLQTASALTNEWTNVASFAGDTFTQNLVITNTVQNSQFFRLFSE